MTSGQNISHYTTAKLSVHVWNHDLIWWQNNIDTQKHFHKTTITSSWTLSKTKIPMMASSNGNSFRVTGPLCEEFTGHPWIPLAKVNGAELSCWLWSAPEQTVKQKTNELSNSVAY